MSSHQKRLLAILFAFVCYSHYFPCTLQILIEELQITAYPNSADNSAKTCQDDQVDFPEKVSCCARLQN